MKSTHYVFVGTVTRVEHEDGKTVMAGRNAYVPAERKKHEVARIVVKAVSLEALQLKVRGHIDLLDDDQTIPALDTDG
jgi:hypothetical protein